MSEEDLLIRAILAAPGDDVLRLVYADWLDERGDPRGEYLRLLSAPGGAAVGDEQAQALLARLDQLRTTLDPRWVALMHRGRVGYPNSPEQSDRPRKGSRRRRRETREADVSLFLRQYARKGSNYRGYDRDLERRVMRMKPEELDRLIRGEEG